MHRWVNLKNPRTAIGLRDDGTILLVVVDGQRNEKPVSEAFSADGGATIEELREVMLALGARDALNLDGGGSSTLVINGKVVNTPSDPMGERPVSDAVIVVSRPE
jgi:exopolysaccharide biosynthesis protein